ncbi:LysR family transcriptional regulator [Phytohalomonas tamaricis]|uniref:LysR family transcriptional regulator n=1 Tax=Phytohalomonas tamaricis TaxID=2081032 RepID=UPI000D0AFB84|nr:LysR family transcriptional regulator [Phytohalomonas tamaricis]
MTEHVENFQFEPNWRRIRAVVAVAEMGGVIRAAEHLHLSQPTVTRAVRELECELGLPLFERHRSGMHPTPAGNIVLPRFRRALEQLSNAEYALAAQQPGNNIDRLAQRLNQRQLTTLIAVANLHSEPRAARQLGLTQPAISASLRDLEGQIGAPLFLRTKRGMLLTDCGEIMVRHAKLAMRELALTCIDLSAWQGLAQGRITIGTLPLSSSLLVPMAVKRLRHHLPEIGITILDGTYDSLLESLRCGEIDLLIGALRQNSLSDDIVQERLFYDRLSVVVHHAHPLAGCKQLTLDELQHAEWIAPRADTPARQSFEQEFLAAGLPPPKVAIEVGNLSTIRTLLLDSDRVTLISPYQVHFELQSGQLVTLPIQMKSTRRPIGITTRRDELPTQASRTLCQQLLEISRDFHL